MEVSHPIRHSLKSALTHPVPSLSSRSHVNTYRTQNSTIQRQNVYNIILRSNAKREYKCWRRQYSPSSKLPDYSGCRPLSAVSGSGAGHKYTSIINSCAKILQYCLRQYVSKKAQSMLKQGKCNGKREKIDSFRLKLLATDMKSIFERHKVST